MMTFKGRHTPKPIILQCVRWYCSYALRYRNIEEMMAERGLRIDHSTLNRWVVHCAPKLKKVQQRYSSQSHVTPVEQFYALAA